LFTATIDGKDYTFGCHTTDTRNGFCHTCYDYTHDKTSKVSYLNRTWESFEYETVLRRAIEKCPKALREELTNQLILHKRAEEHERCEKEFERFKSLHDGLTDKQKQLLAEQPPMQSQADVDRTIGVMAMMNMFNVLGV
jgi:hypothetical protein